MQVVRTLSSILCVNIFTFCSVFFVCFAFRFPLGRNVHNIHFKCSSHNLEIQAQEECKLQTVFNAHANCIVTLNCFHLYRHT